MKSLGVFIGLFILLAFLDEVQGESSTFKSTVRDRFRSCRRTKSGQKQCVCGNKRTYYDPLESNCIKGKIVSQMKHKNSLEFLRLTDKPIIRSTLENDKKLTCVLFYIKNRTSDEFVPLKNVSVDASISSFAADVTLTQIYFNREENPIEAVYSFPIEENAAIYSFTAKIGNRTITAILKEKEIAEKEYKDALSKGHSAFLFQQSEKTLDTFRIDVGLLPPGSECIITIKYVAELELVDGNSIRFVVPTTITPRYNPSLGGVQSPGNTGASYVTKTPYSISFQAQIERGQNYKIMKVANMSHPVNINVTDQTINLSFGPVPLDRDIIFDIDLPEQRPATMFTMEKYSDQDKFAVMLSFVPRLSDFVKISAESHENQTEFIFIVDCSGSMDADDRISLARDALLLFIRGLPVDSYFNIIRFGSHYEVLFRNELMTVIYNETTASKAESLARTLNANLGGTEILEPLQYLHSHPPQPGRTRQVFIITDGEVSNTDEVIELSRKMSATTRMFSFGIGDSPSRSLVKGLARATNGHFIFVPPRSKVDFYVAKQLGRALQPSFVNARVKWSGLEKDSLQAPNIMPPLYVDDRVLVYFMFDQENIRLKNVSAEIYIGNHYFESIRLSTDFIRNQHIIRRLAAKALIQELQHTKNENQSRLEITEISLNHQILSPYTAFIGVETEGPLQNSSESNVRYIPIELSKESKDTYNTMHMYPAMMSFRHPQALSGLPGFGRGYGSVGPQFMPGPIGQRSRNRHQPMYFSTYSVGGPKVEAMADVAFISSPEDSSKDLVRWLIELQYFNGFWILDEDQVLKVTGGKALQSIKTKSNYSKDILTTSIVIAVLDSKYSNEKTLWSAVANKARNQLVRSGLTSQQIDDLINEIKQQI